MRKTFGTGSVWEQTLGYSRAVQVDNTLFISATAASGLVDGKQAIVGDDFYSQTKYILEKLGAVLEDAGRAHGEVFGEIRPTLALVHVLPFLDPEMLVEIELVAQKSA